MRWLHVHRDPDWQVHGANAYYQCRCGARRVKAYLRRLASPTTPGWPPLVDRHGRGLLSTGWVPEPEGGWPVTSRSAPQPPTGRRGVTP